MLKIFSYVISGFFFYTLCGLSFTNSVPLLGKLTIMGIFSIPAVLSLLLGLQASGFSHWKRDVGIVLLSASLVTAFVALGIVCLFATPEFVKQIPDEQKDFLSDYISGLSCLLLMGGTGGLLLYSSSTHAPVDVTAE